MGPDRIHEEPRTTAAGRGVAEVHGQAAGSPAGQAVAVGRPLLGRRHADRGVGLAQELQAQGWRGRRRRFRFPWPEAQDDTHASTSDPDAKLYRKAAGREARLSYMGHVVMENRNGLAVDGRVSQANGTAERRASEAMLKRKARRRGSVRSFVYRQLVACWLVVSAR